MSEFYRSVYTHSIPWALVGKEASKNALRNRQPHWCDALDKVTQWGQDGQTNGIPCGPDTSFVLGEVILSAVDAEVAEALPSVRGYRYYDDYEIAVGSRGEAENALHRLQDELAKFGLQLNPSKTRIVELPLVAEGSLAWAKAFPTLRPLFSHSSRADTRDELLDFFRRVFEARQGDPTSQVVTVAISRIGERSWRGEEWALAQDLMSQAVVSDTGAMQQYVRTLLRLHLANNQPCDPARLRECLSEVIIRHASRGHGSEVAWALWACMAFDVQLSSDCATMISAMDDDVVALLALEHEARKGFVQPLDKSKWLSLMTAEQLRREHWLLAYEAFERGWLRPSGADYIVADPAFSWMRSNNVRFTKRFRKPTPRTLGSIRTGTRSYDEDDDTYEPDDDDDDDDE